MSLQLKYFSYRFVECNEVLHQQNFVSVDKGDDIHTMQNDSQSNHNEMEKMSQLLQNLVSLQTQSMEIEKAIRRQGREIKLDIFPEEYDKRSAPPRMNGKCTGRMV